MPLYADDARLADHGRLVTRLCRHNEITLVLDDVVPLIPRPDVGVPVVPRLGDGIEFETARYPRLVRRESRFRRVPLRLFQRRLFACCQFLEQSGNSVV